MFDEQNVYPNQETFSEGTRSQNQMNYQMNNQVENPVNSQVNNSVERPVNNQVNNSVENSVNSQMNNQTENSVYGQTDNSVNNQTNSQMNNQMNNQAGSVGIDHMKMAQPNADWSIPKRTKKPKKENLILKSAINGIVFGICAALVICMVLVVGNKTFLKQNNQQEQQSQKESEAWIENTETADGQDIADVQDEVTKSANTDEANTDQKTGNKNDKPQQVSNTNGAALSVKEIAERCMPSVVSITTVGVEEVRSMFGTQKYKSQGAGSGIIIGQNEDELLVATNNHVVSSAEEVSICFEDGKEDSVVSAKVKGTDPSNDLAIVAVKKADIPSEYKNAIKIATIGDSDSLSVGEQVVAIGNALGYGQSVTTGIVSALNRDFNMENYSAKLIQTDAAINPGNSGGALINMKGELIGINSAKYASEQIEGMGYAIPIATAQPILDGLMQRETRDLASEDEAGFLGVSIQDVSDEASQMYDIPKGAYVGDVEDGGAAQKAGLRKGDIITKFDGITITGAASLRSNIAYYKTGETVEVIYMRSNNGVYEEKTTSVTLAKSKAIEQQKQGKNPSDVYEDENDEDSDSQEDDSQDQQTNPSNGNSPEDFFRDFFGDGGFGDFFDQFSQGGSGDSGQGQSQNKRSRGL